MLSSMTCDEGFGESFWHVFCSPALTAGKTWWVGLRRLSISGSGSIPPLDVQVFRGKVTLIRWWTDGCSLCSATAPALRKLRQKYAVRSFQVIGVYHPKPPGDVDLERVQRAAAELGFTFPVAVDADWKALRRWWLDQGRRDWTSVSFVIDKRGVIRYVHRGGEFHEGEHASCRRDYR